MREASRDGAVALVSLPRVIPLVILRGSGETHAPPRARSPPTGVRVLAHAEGGGVLYVDAAADPAMTLRSSKRASTGSASATGSTCCSSTASAAGASTALG